MKNPDVCDLSRCFLCRNCLPEWKGAIIAEREVRAYRKGQPIFEEGDEVRGIYFISEGAVKVHQSWGKGKEFILRFANAGDVIGHRGYGGDARLPVSATALDDTRVCFVTSGFLETTFKTNPPFVYTMMQLYATELQKAEKRMRDLAVKPVKSRVAEALFAIRETFGSDESGYFRIPVTRLDIAGYAGTTYEAVFRLLSEWTEAGLVSTAGKKIRIDDEKKLSRLFHPDQPDNEEKQ